MRIRAKGILVLVWIIAILGALLVWTCDTQAGRGGGEPPQQQMMQQMEEEPHNHEAHPSLWHENTQAMIASIIGSIALLGGSIFGGVCALRAAKARRQQQE